MNKRYRYYHNPMNEGEVCSLYKTDGEQVWTWDEIYKEWINLEEDPEIFAEQGEDGYFSFCEPISEKEVFIEIL